jgi:hypothetical protein
MLKDLLYEIKNIMTGQTIDAILPPVIFVIMKDQLPLKVVVGIVLVLSLLIFFRRLLKKQKLLYSVFGLSAVLVAITFSLISGSSKTFFLPELLGAGFLLFLALMGSIFNQPIAMWLSHLTRNFPIGWYRRKDVYPAYKEVSYIWTALLVVRFTILLYVFVKGSTNDYFVVNAILGLPVTIIVLSISYVYGMIKLSRLKGPSVEEFTLNQPPPFKGQKKGF